MSWLFPALIPVLLMVATFGLERLETALSTGEQPDEIDEWVAQTPPNIERPTPVPAPVTGSWASRHRSYLADHCTFTGLPTLELEPGLPTRLRRSESGNPQFQPTRHANPV